jgi:class 3 adenylate cyclase/DNA-binding SARP family transcriptional activator/tetratricopeptide (TPR) repeat protein
MEFRVLGPLEVVEGGRAVDLGGAKQRALLALLAINANHVVSRDRLVEALWEDEPPETAGKALQVYVSQLRKQLGRERLETGSSGYLLRLDPDELDLARFQRLHESGRPEAALALWRGDPLADFAEQRFAQAEIARLQELRLSCIEQRVERDLAEGHHAELVGELDALVREHPLREHLRAQLMLAFYRAGRQAEALEAYQNARSSLVDELGIEPGRPLRELHQQILRQDPDLDLPAPKHVEHISAAAKPSHRQPPARPGEVRKTVTVVFCDLADSTELGERLDPESLRALMARWYNTMRVPLEGHGGTVEKFIGDAVMAVFGVPQVHEDDALRAVLAAVEMRRALAALNAEVGSDLRIRIGVNSGEVVAGEGSATLVTGDAVNTAKRLEEAAAPGEILISSVTRQLVQNATELEPAGEVLAKGKKEPVETWRVLGTIPGAAPFARRLDAPLIGRTRELAFLRDELADAERARACRLVTVYGAAGIGKSRLAAEFLADARSRADVLTARCLPYGDGITFLPLAELVRSVGGEGALSSAVEREPDGALIVERVRGALGSDVQPSTSEETFWAVRRLLETLASERPLVICVEDVHWAEPMFLDLLEYVAGWSRDAPIVLLCLARPELLDARPRWGGTALTLGPLTDTESEQLLDELAAEWPITPGARGEIADRAEGNPLFLEQMIAMISGHGALPRDVPPTIQALLAARLDQLEPLERSVLERAALVGKEFWRGAVLELSPADERAGVSPALLSLVRKELVRPAKSAFVGDDGFRFRHALICDAAYSAMAKRTRSELHEQFAAWLERHEGEDELVGYHLERAAQYCVELGVSDEALSKRAATMLAAAGQRAFARDDARAAASLFLRACELLRSDDAARLEPLRRARLALWSSGNFEDARRLLDEQITLAATLGNAAEEWSGRLDLAASDFVTGSIDADGLLEVAEEAIRVFDPGDNAGLARAWRRVAHAYEAKGRYADSGEAAERALAHAHASGERFEEARIVDLLCTSLLYGPASADAALLRCERMLGEADGKQVLGANIAAALVGLLGMRGEFDAARKRARFAEEIYLELDLQLAFAGLTQITGPMELLAGDPAAAARELQRGLDVLQPRGSDSYQEALLAGALYELGRLEEADRHARTAEAHAPVDSVQAQVAWRGVRAKLEAPDSPEQARMLAAEAVSLAQATDATNLLADALADLAVVSRLTHDDSAADITRRALTLYEQKGNVAAARRLSEVLATAS